MRTPLIHPVSWLGLAVLWTGLVACDGGDKETETETETETGASETETETETDGVWAEGDWTLELAGPSDSTCGAVTQEAETVTGRFGPGSTDLNFWMYLANGYSMVCTFEDTAYTCDEVEATNAYSSNATLVYTTVIRGSFAVSTQTTGTWDTTVTCTGLGCGAAQDELGITLPCAFTRAMDGSAD